jgi:aminopeptidase
MLSEIQLERYADVLLWGLHTARNGRYKKGDIVLVRFHPLAMRLAEILHARLMDAGINPVLRLNPTPTMEQDFFQLANAKQLTFQIPGEEDLFRHLNGAIFLHAPESITHLSRVDPKKIGRHAVSRKPLRDIMDDRDARGLFGWTLCMLPTAAQTEHAQMTLRDYTDQIVKACRLHRRDAVAQWRSLFKKAQEVKRWLNSMDTVRLQIESDHMDLTVTPGAQRRWVGISGHNIPSFEVFFSPDWRGTEGVYYANLPSYRSGNLVKDVRVVFRKGTAVQIDAAQGAAFIRQQAIMDRGASRIGEFSLTDKRFSKIDRFMANTLFDENFGGAQGNCHIALGSSYADTYAGNLAELDSATKRKLGFNDSALHWDLVNTEKKRVVAHLSGGRKTTIYENGVFQY